MWWRAATASRPSLDHARTAWRSRSLPNAGVGRGFRISGLGSKGLGFGVEDLGSGFRLTATCKITPGFCGVLQCNYSMGTMMQTLEYLCFRDVGGLRVTGVFFKGLKSGFSGVDRIFGHGRFWGPGIASVSVCLCPLHPRLADGPEPSSLKPGF